MQNQVLTKDDVVPIFELRAQGVAVIDIARHYGVRPSSIRRVLIRESHKKVEVPEKLMKQVRALFYKRASMEIVQEGCPC